MGKTEKLRAACDMADVATRHSEDITAERVQAGLTYHNTACRGQWDQEDLEYLAEQGRPALTFNVSKPKVDAICGLLSDARQRPQMRGTGADDRLSAEVWNDLYEKIRKTSKLDIVDDEVGERGVQVGEGICHLDVIADPQNPLWIKIEASFINPNEISWDPGSEAPDRRDAAYFVWDKWLTASEFEVEYPDSDIDIRALISRDGMGGEERDGTWMAERVTGGESDLFESEGRQQDYDSSISTRWYDKRRHQVRVAHIEYKEAVKTYCVYEGGEKVGELSSKQAVSNLEKLRDEGQLPADVQVIATWSEKVHWLEFIRDMVLDDRPNPMPFDSFSVFPFSCYFDSESNDAYGAMRNLLDPQAEVNKSKSMTLDWVISQSKPGWVAEDGTIPDQTAFEEALIQGGTVANVSKGALTGAAVRERQQTALPSDMYKRTEEAIFMIDRIGGVAAEIAQSGSTAEAAATVQLRYRAAQLALSQIFRHYAIYQHCVAEAIFQVLQRAMPDEQIEALLGDTDRFVVRRGTVIELEDKKPKGAIKIDDARSLTYDVEMTTTSENEAIRLMDLMIFEGLAKAGIPVDPELVLEKAATNRYDRERLIDFARQSKESQAAAAKEEKESFARQLQQGLQIEQLKAKAKAGDTAESSRHNRATEQLDAAELVAGTEVDVIQVWEKADAAEKSFISQMIQLISNRAAAREAAATTPSM